jgi:hypothetical protein
MIKGEANKSCGWLKNGWENLFVGDDRFALETRRVKNHYFRTSNKWHTSDYGRETFRQIGEMRGGNQSKRWKHWRCLELRKYWDEPRRSGFARRSTEALMRCTVLSMGDENVEAKEDGKRSGKSLPSVSIFIKSNLRITLRHHRRLLRLFVSSRLSSTFHIESWHVSFHA